ncbi:MAG: hypothetical protein SFV19_06600 [Rhodospirillaceae bacterium]|nr:hypothetical protein [Rhodospirillaceae bacterium]
MNMIAPGVPQGTPTAGLAQVPTPPNIAQPMPTPAPLKAKPRKPARPKVKQSGSKGMSEDQLERLLATEIEQALSFIHSSDLIAAQRERNYDYYRGVMDDVPAARGRSRVTDRTLSAYINMMLPGLLRVFTAGKDIALYEPTGLEDEALAKLVTRYVNDVVFRKDNRGEIILYQWAFDALVQKVGVLKVWWHEEHETKDDTLMGLTDEEFVLVVRVAEYRGDEIIAHTAHDATPAAAEQPNVMDSGVGGTDGAGQVVPLPQTHDITIRRKINKSRVRIENVPPEEFVINRDARTLEDATLVSHRTYRRAGELMAQGYPLALIDTLPTFSEHRYIRRGDDDERQRGPAQAKPVDPMMREIAVHEGIVRCDYDGKGVREWFFVAAGGEGRVKVLTMEPYAHQVVFADFCPNPLPHMFWGRCPADDLAEIQKVNTVLIRQMLDNLYLSNTPQREVVQDLIVKPDQLMNMAPGAPILVKQAGAIREISVPFTAQAALTAIQYFEAVAETRTGISRQSAGLEPNTLANQSATAANIAYSASLGKIEMIARIWAHGGMRKLFRGILNILTRYQDFQRIVRMDGRAQAVDPQAWASFTDMDVVVNTGLGTGARERDMMFLGNVLKEQKEILQSLGPANPIVGLKQYVTALHKTAEAAGITNPQAFFRDPGDWAPPAPPPPGPPQPTPDTSLMAQVEAKKLEQKNVEAAAQLKSQERIAMQQIASNERIALAQVEAQMRLREGAAALAGEQSGAQP